MAFHKATPKMHLFTFLLAGHLPDQCQTHLPLYIEGFGLGGSLSSMTFLLCDL